MIAYEEINLIQKKGK